MTDKNNQNPSKPDEPRQRTQKDTRKELLDRIVGDMTYKSGTPEQRVIWTWIVAVFAGFKQEVKTLLEHSEIPQRLIHTGEYHTYEKELRRAERWANAAVANDWKKDSAFNPDDAEPLKYPVEPGESGTSEKHKLCDEISRMCFELDTLMAQYLPEGRSLSLFTTKMQEVRGSLLDTVNMNVIEPPSRAKQAVITNVQP